MKLQNIHAMQLFHLVEDNLALLNHYLEALQEKFKIPQIESDDIKQITDIE